MVSTTSACLNNTTASPATALPASDRSSFGLDTDRPMSLASLKLGGT